MVVVAAVCVCGGGGAREIDPHALTLRLKLLPSTSYHPGNPSRPISSSDSLLHPSPACAWHERDSKELVLRLTCVSLIRGSTRSRDCMQCETSGGSV
jgi:hypothetical protein